MSCKTTNMLRWLNVDAHFCKLRSKSPWEGKTNKKQGLKTHQEDQRNKKEVKAYTYVWVEKEMQGKVICSRIKIFCRILIFFLQNDYGKLKQIGLRRFWSNEGQQAYKAYNIFIKEEEKLNLSLGRNTMK